LISSRGLHEALEAIKSAASMNTQKKWTMPVEKLLADHFSTEGRLDKYLEV